MGELHRASHAVYDIQYHLVWTTKYRYKVLTGDIALRLRELLRQSCDARGVTIIRGSVGRGHVHMLVSCPPTLSVSKMMQYLKGCSSRMMQEGFVSLRKRYCGQHLWSGGYFCRTVGSVTEEMINEYIEQQIDESEEVFKIVDDDA
jgi:putative transposase